MIDKITKSGFRALLDSVGYRHSVDEDGDYFMILNADDTFSHDVVVYYIINEKNSTVKVLGVASGFKISNNDRAHALLKCNQWHQRFLVGQAYLQNDRLEFSLGFFLDEPVSESYVKENVIKLSSHLAWKFFSTLKNED